MLASPEVSREYSRITTAQLDTASSMRGALAKIRNRISADGDVVDALSILAPPLADTVAPSNLAGLKKINNTYLPRYCASVAPAAYRLA